MMPLKQSHDARTSNSPRPLAGEGLGEREKSTALNNAKALRTNQTDAEQRLWYHLRAHRFMDLKFKRQRPMGSYIVDFVCEEHRLIIEIDGGQHQAEQATYDQQRDAWLHSQGYTVLRFWNNDVMQNLEGVLEKIRSTLTLSPAPLVKLLAIRLGCKAAKSLVIPQAGEGSEKLAHIDDPLLQSPRPFAGEG